MTTAERTARPAAGQGDLAPGELPRLLPGRWAGRATLASHLARHGPLPVIGPGAGPRRQLIAEVGRAGLTGRGGAAFPTARKLAAVTATRRSPVVIANGTEGEPASAKDKVLLAQAPHLVLDGAVLAATLIGTRQAIVVVHTAVREIVDDAAAERRRIRYDPAPVRVLTGAGRFVAGEASALVNWVGHGIAAPTAVPPRVSERGLGGRPTLVQNVETLAHLALIARHGAAWFRSLGTPAEPGSMLVTIIGAVREPGVYEIGIGTPVGDVLAVAGGLAAPLTALLVGGYSGTWVGLAAAAARPFSVAGLRSVGASPGAGLVAALPAGACGLAETARLARYLADESAGQCGPCVFGLGSIATELVALAAGRPVDLGRVGRWLGQVDGRGGCHHADGAVRKIRSALDVFAPEIAEHARGWCSGTRPGGMLPVPPRAADERRKPAPGRSHCVRRTRILRGDPPGGDHPRRLGVSHHQGCRCPGRAGRRGQRSSTAVPPAGPAAGRAVPGTGGAESLFSRAAGSGADGTGRRDHRPYLPGPVGGVMEVTRR